MSTTEQNNLKPRISILCPTRNRPESVKRLINSGFDTAVGPIEFVLYVDHDDPTKDEVLSLESDYVRVIVGDRCILSVMWNRCFDQAKADIFMHCGDDIVFRTNKWDNMVVREFAKVPDKILLVHGRDGFQDDRIATHGFLHRKWVETVGYFVPPFFASDYNDMWLTLVADVIGRRVYLPYMYTEHMHPLARKGTWDITHQERLIRHKSQKVDQKWRSTQNLRERDVLKLRAVINKSGGLTLTKPEESHDNLDLDDIIDSLGIRSESIASVGKKL